MRQSCTRTVGELRGAIDQWREGFLGAACLDGGRHLLHLPCGDAVLDAATRELDLFLANLSFCLLDHGVALWAEDDAAIPAGAWTNLLRHLRDNRYGQDQRRYVLELHRSGLPTVALGASSLSAQPSQARLGELFAASPFLSVTVRDRLRTWTRHAAGRGGRAVVESLDRDQNLSLDLGFHGDEMHCEVRRDHDRVERDEQLQAHAETVSGALGRQGFLCGEPRPVASNAARVPMARSKRLADALLLLPAHRAASRGEIVLLATPRVLESYGLLIAPSPGQALAATARKAGVPLLAFEELIRNDNQERLRIAARGLPA